MNFEGAIEPGDRQLSSSGIQGVAHEATVSQGAFTGYYSLWVAAHHGYNYKLAVYGDQTDKSVIDHSPAQVEANVDGNRQTHRAGQSLAYRNAV
jgi:hypothetical protein